MRKNSEKILISKLRGSSDIRGRAFRQLDSY